MKFSPFATFSSDDFSKAPEYVQKLINNINPVLNTLNTLFQNNVDISNNLLAERQTVNIQHGVPVQLTLRTLAQQPRLVRAGFAGGEVVTGCSITGYDGTGLNPIVTVYFQSGTSAVTAVLLVLEP